jgi:cytochrome c biogenesis protein CcmG/thiol:disulfide interchange protein DsbE
MNWRVAGIVALLVLPLLWVLGWGFGHDPHAVPSVLESRPAPAFTLQSLDGKSVSLAGLRGRPVVINFWASWCEPCAVEHGALQAMAKAYDGRVQFLGIVYQDTAENAAQYLKSQGNAFPQLLDPDTRVAIDYGIAGVPESFVIDAQGVIRKKFVGVLNPGDLSAVLDPLLTGSAPL